MILVVIISHKCNINPDNVATPSKWIVSFFNLDSYLTSSLSHPQLPHHLEI